jgi:predicted alpha/beta-hydrolase family hydrolase
VRSLSIETSRGPAGIRITDPAGPPTSLLILGHGAGGDVDAPDLTAVHDAAVAAGVRVALVTQPYRMAGRRAPAPAHHLDEAWTTVVDDLTGAPAGAVSGGAADGLAGAVSGGAAGRLVGVGPGGVPRGSAGGVFSEAAGGLPVILGGRSSGARVACRTAGPLGAAGVLALAFPLHPPGKPERSRAGELPTGIPTLVVNGDRDPFGVPEPAGSIEVAVRPGAVHDLRRDLPGTAAIVLTWLRAHGWSH